MGEWKKLEDDEEDEDEGDEFDKLLETIIEESNISALPRTLSRAIIPVLETSSVQQPLGVRLRGVRTENEIEDSPNPNYSLDNNYMSNNAYQGSEPLEPVPGTLQPQSMGQGSSNQSVPSAPGYPGQRNQTKNYESNLEQQAKRQRDERRRG